VLQLLSHHPWPGNVRQLEHVVQRAIIDSGGLVDHEVVERVLASMDDGAATPDDLPRAGDEITLKELERHHLEAVLRRCGGNRSRAARVLGIERKTLYRKAARLGIALDVEEEP
jgi:DNA-binding NtrC family response regulator